MVLNKLIAATLIAVGVPAVWLFEKIAGRLHTWDDDPSTTDICRRCNAEVFDAQVHTSYCKGTLT